ncbi:MAG: hypothetical protein GF398_02980 [Chitinivibrionales bacterium]|nr:hypothetical protein [Chitinivibrionales bacterium]
MNFQPANARVPESRESFDIPVVLPFAPRDSARLTYSVLSATATKGKDFALAGNGSLVFYNSETLKT